MHSQVLSQYLFVYDDGSITIPSITNACGFEIPELVEWQQMNQFVLSLLLSFLTKEAISIVVGLPSSHVVWSILETIFSHRFKSHELRHKDDLQHMKKNSRSFV